ncbi:hypothetical protein KR76_00114 [Pimelobacter simplex]|uniref:Uncharacterized protein n=1 Tax=Nocardioides simplex TaxID=2045 RepID=A0A0C5XH98_NOCSI|nr:hypothetical protein KR76_00114 [Pimelobacter simplex]
MARAHQPVHLHRPRTPGPKEIGTFVPHRGVDRSGLADLAAPARADCLVSIVEGRARW